MQPTTKNRIRTKVFSPGHNKYPQGRKKTAAIRNEKNSTTTELSGNWLSVLTFPELRWPTKHSHDAEQEKLILINNCIMKMDECYRLHAGYIDFEIHPHSTLQEIFHLLYTKLSQLAIDKGWSFKLIQDDEAEHGIVGALVEEIEFFNFFSIDLIQLFHMRRQEPEKYKIMRSLLHWVEHEKRIPNWMENAMEHYDSEFFLDHIDQEDEEEVNNIKLVKESFHDYQNGKTSLDIQEFYKKKGILSIKYLRQLIVSDQKLQVFITSGLKLLDLPINLSDYYNSFEWDAGFRPEQVIQFGWNREAPVERHYTDYLDMMAESGEDQIPLRRIITIDASLTEAAWDAEPLGDQFLTHLREFMDAYDACTYFKMKK